jgi:hypothetical protein
MRIHLFASAIAGLFAAMIGAADAIAEQAGRADPQGQTVFETKGITLDARDMAKWASANYWEQKVGKAFKLAWDLRMQADAEERDAVLATVWQLKPEAVNTETKIVAIIPRRPTKPQSKDIAYQISFIPRTSAQDADSVETRFISEGLGSRPIVTSAPAAGVIPLLPPTFSYAGFPKNDVVRYWVEHPGDMRSILSWIAASANPGFDQVLTTKVVEGTAAHSANFHVTGTKVPAGPILKLSIVFLGEAAPITSALPANYHGMDFADLQIEKAQTRTQGHDKLGTITGIAELPAEERLPAKYAISRYFEVGARDAEIDAIVPIPNAEKRALLDLRFGASNDVSVRRIGEDRKGSALEAPGAVRRVNGFSANSANVSIFLAWLRKRYPAIIPKGTTLPELENSVTAEIQMRSGTPAWFKENYGIEILPAAVAQSQLSRLFQYKAPQLAGLQDFTSSELQVLEVTLEKMSDQLVARFKGLQMARQKTAIQLVGISTAIAINEQSEAGVALLRGNDRSIVIFDSVNLNAESLFMGGLGPDGKPEVAAETLLTFAHELGHVVAATPGVKESFDGLVRTKMIKPVTWYAASKPKDEFFPEAFALYVGDPEWLSDNRPDLFRWFETLSGNKSKN